MEKNQNKNDMAFHAALNICWNDAKWGDKTDLAISSNLSQSYLNNLAKGRKHGTEKSRRAIAKAFGFKHYEAFLDVGRKALGLPTMAEEAASVANQVPEWLKPMLNDLSNLDEHGQKAVKAAIDAFKK